MCVHSVLRNVSQLLLWAGSCYCGLVRVIVGWFAGHTSNITAINIPKPINYCVIFIGCFKMLPQAA